MMKLCCANYLINEVLFESIHWTYFSTPFMVACNCMFCQQCNRFRWFTTSIFSFLSNATRFSCLDWNGFIIILTIKTCITMRYSITFNNIQILSESGTVIRKYTGMVTAYIRNCISWERSFWFVNFSLANFVFFKPFLWIKALNMPSPLSTFKLFNMVLNASHSQLHWSLPL